MILRPRNFGRSSASIFLKSIALLIVMIVAMTANVSMASGPNSLLQPVPPGSEPGPLLPGRYLMHTVGAPAEESLTEESTVDLQEIASQEPVELDHLDTENNIYLPLVLNQKPVSTRLGFGLAGGDISSYEDVTSLRAGWYLDWTVRVNPIRPNNMQFAQMVRLHQKLACPLGSANAWDRELCPYEDDYIVSPSISTIKAAAAANRGSLWLIGNEMERRDFQVCRDWPTCDDAYTDGQDEILPEKYAEAYHDLYTAIKEVDPIARIAIGGVIQPTPLRLEYLDRVWNSYQARYGKEMPVDVWNVHIFALREGRDEYGADIPAGLSATKGEYTDNDCAHLSRTDFDLRIRAMRQWMKEKGQQNKPLIISEYGPLYHQIYIGEAQVDGKQVCSDPSVDPANPQNVRDFMLWTFDYFLETKDPELGYPEDDYRLVQKWNWFSLNHASFDDQGNIIRAPLNAWTSLFDITKQTLTETGKLFRDYSLANLTRLMQ
jgi:hypothetical protein